MNVKYSLGFHGPPKEFEIRRMGRLEEGLFPQPRANIRDLRCAKPPWGIRNMPGLERRSSQPEINISRLIGLARP